MFVGRANRMSRADIHWECFRRQTPHTHPQETQRKGATEEVVLIEVIGSGEFYKAVLQIGGPMCELATVESLDKVIALVVRECVCVCGGGREWRQ